MATLESAVSAIPDVLLRKLLMTISEAGEMIAKLCRAPIFKTTTRNEFGDEQLSIDLLSNQAMFEHLARSGVVRIASSEETPVEKVLSTNAVFAVVFDPLDGSSIIGSNFAVGTIIGIFDLRDDSGNVRNSIIGLSGEDMVASVSIVYGPRTTMYIAHPVLQVQEFTFHPTWLLTDTISGLNKSVHVFSPANLRATQDNAGYNNLISYYLKEKYTLRYTGGMVPDVIQILVKRGGVFLSPVSKAAKAKLRLIYEVLPMGFLVVMAGGVGKTEGKDVLKRRINGLDERVDVFLGSKEEMEIVDRLFMKKGGNE